MRWSWRSRSAGVAFAITCLALALFASTAMASFPGANGLIAFERQAGSGGIWTMHPDGSELQRLRDGAQPSWSPNGRWITYVCFPRTETFDQVCMMRADGSDVRQITFGGLPPSYPVFLPSGGRILFYREGLHSDPGGTYIIKTDGSNEHRVGDAFGGAWAPNGKHIAYSRYNRASNENAIWVMRTDGSGRRLLYSGGEHPRYTPNSRSIIFEVDGTRMWMQMGAGGANPHPLDTSPIDAEVDVAPAGGCMFGIVLYPGTGAGSSVYARGARCPVTGFLAGGYAYNPSWQPLPDG